MIAYYIGTMGFSYKDWNGVFYPADTAQHRYLAYYSRIFNAAEIDSTFYGAPKPEVVEHWAAITPAGFKLCLKVPRVITHDLVLEGAQGLMDEFTGAARLLGEKLGVLLFQFPPSFESVHLARLDNFLAELPAGLRFAVEIRNPSWYAAHEETERVLARHGVAWAATQYPGLPARIYPTASFLYVRWIGQHGKYPEHSHERVDRSAELEAWRQKIEANAPGKEAVYGFFNNDYAGFAPATANRFKSIAGLPVEPLTPPQQGKLF